MKNWLQSLAVWKKIKAIYEKPEVCIVYCFKNYFLKSLQLQRFDRRQLYCIINANYDYQNQDLSHIAQIYS